MNNLFIKLDTGFMMGHHRIDQDYTDAAAIASALVDQYHPGTSSYDWVIAGTASVKSHCISTGFTTDDFEISQKSEVPGNHTVFLPDGVDLVDVQSTDLVLHCLTSAE